MSALMDFLLETPVDNITAKVVVSARLQQHTFTVRPMDSDDYSSYQKSAIKISKGKKVDFDEKLFSERVVINHCIEPDFKNAEAIKKAGVVTPAQLLQKVLLAGEISGLARQIMELSGFYQDMDELVDEAKNS